MCIKGRFSPKGAERLKIACQAILAKAHTAAVAIAHAGPSLKSAKGLIS
jgi:hypothetical protein